MGLGLWGLNQSLDYRACAVTHPGWDAPVRGFELGLGSAPCNLVRRRAISVCRCAIDLGVCAIHMTTLRNRRGTMRNKPAEKHVVQRVPCSRPGERGFRQTELHFSPSDRRRAMELRYVTVDFRHGY